MQEKNRHILIKGIKDMPEHEPPFGLWENIEIMMLPVPRTSAKTVMASAARVIGRRHSAPNTRRMAETSVPA